MQNEKARFATLLVVCGSMFVPSAFGAPIAIFNTGQATMGGLAQPVGSIDLHYDLAGPGGTPPTAYATNPNPAWVANQPMADWISPGTDGSQNFPVGTYDYTTTFNLAGFDASTAQLSGSWTADNNATIFLNGVSTGDSVGFADFGSLQPFSITSGFMAGTNTLDFRVTNGGTSPTGLIAEVSGTVSPVPEPSSWLLMGTGLLGLCGVLRGKLTARPSQFTA